MNKNDYILKTIAHIATVQNLNKSNLDKSEALLLNCFFLLLRKERIIPFSTRYRNFQRIHLGFGNTDFDSGHKETITSLLKANKNEPIKLMYDEYIKDIISTANSKYIAQIITIFISLSSQDLNEKGSALFDHLLSSHFNRFSGSSSMQPKELTIIFNHFFNDKEHASYYNPFSGLSSLALDLPKHINYFGEEVDEIVWLLGQLRMQMNNPKTNYKVALNDCVYDSVANTNYDFIAFNPPFNLNLDEDRLTSNQKKSEYIISRNANAFIISENFKKLKKNGKMVFIIPSGFLSSSNPKEKALKKFLTDNNHIESVISLPQRILSFSSVNVSLISLSKNASKPKHIKFIDATSLILSDKNKVNVIDVNAVLQLIDAKSDTKLLKHISNKEISSNQYNLAVNRYVFEPLNLSPDQESELVRLESIISPTEKLSAKTSEGVFIKISDLAQNDTVSYTRTFEDVVPRTLRGDSCLLQNNDVLLSLVGTNIKPTLFKATDKQVFYPNTHILAFQINEDLVDIDYLILELRKTYIQKQLKQKRQGSAMPLIKRKDLLQIQVVMPSLEEQRRKKYSYQESIINAQKDKVKGLMLEYGIDVADENSFLRHKIAGTLRNIRGSFSKLKLIIEQQVVNDVPELYQYKANPKLEGTFLDYLNRIERDLGSMHNSVQTVGKELNLQEIQHQPINFLSFINDYVDDIKNRTSRNFSINLNTDTDKLRESKIKEIIVQGDKEILHQIFDNVIENAEKHAFTDTSKIKNRIEVELLYDFEELEVQLDFTNTGNPLPKDYTFEEFTRRGSKSGAHAGSGLGGWFIYQVMKRHNGKFGFTDETGPEGIKGDYATTIELTFPIQIKI